MNWKLGILLGIFLMLELVLFLTMQTEIAIWLFKLGIFLFLFAYFGKKILSNWNNSIKLRLNKKDSNKELLIFYFANIIFVLILRLISNLPLIISEDWYLLLVLVGFLGIFLFTKFEDEISTSKIVLASIGSTILILIGFAYFFQIEILNLIDQLKIIFKY